MQSHMKITRAFMIVLTVIASVGLVPHEPDAAEHPAGITRDVIICSDCHTDWRASLSHTVGYATRHKLLSAQNFQACNICHKKSFCSDCHPNKEEIKPSNKFKDAAERVFPHRGDYITRHKIDGRMDPVLCARCHGRTNNARCKRCHR